MLHSPDKTRQFYETRHVQWRRGGGLKHHLTCQTKAEEALLQCVWVNRDNTELKTPTNNAFWLLCQGRTSHPSFLRSHQKTGQRAGGLGSGGHPPKASWQERRSYTTSPSLKMQKSTPYLMLRFYFGSILCGKAYKHKKKTLPRLAEPLLRSVKL